MKTKISLLLMLATMTTACIHKQSGPVTAWERVNVNMAAMAQINEAVANGVIAAQKTGTITVQQAAPILNFQESVAKDHMAIENILLAGSAQAGNQPQQIKAMLTEIGKQGTVLIQSGGLGIKNPQSQQTFAQDLQAIVNLANLVLAEFQSAQGK
jgi:hypothetical protein